MYDVFYQVAAGNTQLVAFLQSVVTGVGTAGVYTWLVSAIVIEWQQRTKGELSNDAKRALTVGVPLVSILAAYLLGAALGGWAITGDSALAAIRVLFVELGGAKVLFTGTKAVESKNEANKAFYSGADTATGKRRAGASTPPPPPPPITPTT